MNKIICLFLFLIIFTSCKTSSKIVTTKSKAHSSVANRKTSQLIDDIVTTATDNIGVRYKAAGTTSSGFDWSGVGDSTFSQYDMALPRTSIEQSKTGTDLGKNTNKAQKGDLIFFRTNNRSQINHVGIITEVTDDEIKFVHASTSKGVIISSTKQAYYQKTFAQINRVLE